MLEYDMSDFSRLDMNYPSIYTNGFVLKYPMVTKENKEEYITALANFVNSQVQGPGYIPKVTTKSVVEQVYQYNEVGDEYVSNRLRVYVFVNSKVERADTQGFVADFFEETLTGAFGYEFFLNAEEDLYVPMPAGELNGFDSPPPIEM